MNKDLPPQSNSPVHSCPDCKKPLRRLSGKMGPFWGCSGFPSCKTTLNDLNGKPSKLVNDAFRCPVCTRRMIKSSGEYWYCSGYSKGCKVKVEDDNGKPVRSYRCMKCGQLLVRREGKNGIFWGCSEFPVCSATYKDVDGSPSF